MSLFNVKQIKSFDLYFEKCTNYHIEIVVIVAGYTLLVFTLMHSGHISKQPEKENLRSRGSLLVIVG